MRVGLLGLATLYCTLLFLPMLAAASAPAAEGEAVIPPGYEELLAAMLGRGAALPGECRLTAGQVDPAVVKGSYKCADGEVVIELRYPSNAPVVATHTSRFAIVLLNGSPPHGFMDALAARVRSREAGFEWTLLQPPPPSWLRRNFFAVTGFAAAGLFAVAALRWMRARLARCRQAALQLRQRLVRWERALLGRMRPRVARWWQAAQRFSREPAAEMKRILRGERFWLVTIFLTSALARGWLSIINPAANDDHFEVANLIRNGGWLPPASSACMECSHAKLYHYTLAFIVELTNSGAAGRMVGNLLNFVAGTALLVLLLAVSRRLRCSPAVRVLALAFMSFNAALVGIFSQTTNDGFCILFSSLAIFSLQRFFAVLALKHVVAATVFVIFAALSKASGWTIFASGAGILCITLLAAETSRRKTYAVATIVFVLGFLCVVPFLNPYRDNLVHAHTLVVGDAFQDPLNAIEVPRPPVAWVFQDFFTFRIFELIRVPYVSFGDSPPSLHRTSLWSELYGRTFFLRFDQDIWQNLDPRLLSLGRLCLVLGLLPLAALLVGTVDLARSVRRGVAVRGVRWLAAHHEWEHLVYIGVLFAALVPMLIKYHRLLVLFTWMKAIYLLPVIVPLFTLFLDGLERLWRWRPRLVTGWMIAMVAASIADLGWLIHDLLGAS